MDDNPPSELDTLKSKWEVLAPSDFMDLWYRQAYTCTSYAGTSAWIQKMMHRSLERSHSEDASFSSTLEVGAGEGEHLSFVKHKFQNYIMTDIREVSSRLYDSRGKTGTSWARENVESLSYEDNSFDRVLHMCLLHHLSNPEQALLEIRRVLKSGGIADLFLSADPGFLFRLARNLGPYRQAKKMGLGAQKRLADARDHANSASSLMGLIKHVYRYDQIKIRGYPTFFPALDFSTWFTFRITKHQ